jgi:hypothetical protein
MPVEPEVRSTGVGMSPVAEGEQGSVYAAVVVQLLQVDHALGGVPEWKAVHVVETTDGSGGSNTSQAELAVLPEPVRARVAEMAMEVAGVQIEWMTEREADTAEQEGIGAGQAIITLGNIHVSESGTVAVTGSIEVGELGARGRTYTVEQVDGVWKVTGDTGVIWLK